MSGARALIVVASQTQGLLLKLLLEEQGIEAGCVDGVEAAVAELAKHPVDLLMVEGDASAPRTVAELRQHCPAPTILLGSAERAAVVALPADSLWADPADSRAVVREAMAVLERRNAPPTVSDILKRARILIVDDSATYREFLRAELEDAGCHVVAARNADEAVVALQDGGLDCVILDLVMPETSGTQLCERFDRFRRRRGLFFQIVILTSQEGEDRLTASLTAGADDFVGKSQPMEVLKIRLMALLRRKYMVEDHLHRVLHPVPSA
ncbi:response regulator transcription factor [Azospirillum soli]|uniref:response regulator transcription factor n=1 Tax=Azospirillum soli TaxID=1304799 RepID=UPI001AEACD3A|nr:response regulator [Azospirillum soli]MBP2313134.1 DNA-binding response OmpR family regulator [Azospirillum soli]